jgi:hypothetical protein
LRAFLTRMNALSIKAAAVAFGAASTTLWT